MKLLLQKDQRRSFEQGEWINMLTDRKRCKKDAKGKMTQYKKLHTYYHAPERLHRIKCAGRAERKWDHTLVFYVNN